MINMIIYDNHEQLDDTSQWSPFTGVLNDLKFGRGDWQQDQVVRMVEEFHIYMRLV